MFRRAAVFAIMLAASAGCSLFGSGETPQQKFLDALNRGNSAQASQIWLTMTPEDLAVREAHRVLRAGGIFAFTAWAKPDEALGFRIALRALEDFGDPGVQLPPGPPFFRFSDREECARVLASCGFAGVTVTQLPLIWKLASAADLFEAFYTGSARTGGMLRAQPPAALAKVRDAIQESAAAFRCGDHLEIPMPALVVSARKASAK